MSHSSSGFFIFVTFVVSLVLMLLPMPEWAIWYRPIWPAIVLIYWIIEAPHSVNLGVAWVTGICLDVLNGTLLGEHALGMILMAYFVARLHTQLRMFPLLQQAVFVFFLILFYQFVIFCVQGFIGQLPTTWLYWSASVTSMLLWPWVFSIINSFRRRFRTI